MGWTVRPPVKPPKKPRKPKPKKLNVTLLPHTLIAPKGASKKLKRTYQKILTIYLNRTPPKL